MPTNLGNLDRILRAVLGLALIAVAFFSDMALFDTAVLKYGAVMIGLVLIATAVLRFCPLYRVLRIKTNQQ
ncbi:MAG: DUF2892 domain-containing protein [Gammaproteobacteria bacterium]|nr:DUF2892 domain-containing protein [Gammaproteobacteria bacterium]